MEQGHVIVQFAGDMGQMIFDPACRWINYGRLEIRDDQGDVVAEYPDGSWVGVWRDNVIFKGGQDAPR